MLIRLSNLPTEGLTDFPGEVERSLADAGLAALFRTSSLGASGQEVTRGDPVTIAAILLTAVASGGALTVALGKNGFLTRLAQVLETLARRRIDVTVELGKKKVHISGSSKDIEKMLKKIM
jgi:hypothetical protein